MGRNPKKERALCCHGAGDSKEIPQPRPGFEAAVSKESVEARRNADCAQNVHAEQER